MTRKSKENKKSVRLPFRALFRETLLFLLGTFRDCGASRCSKAHDFSKNKGIQIVVITPFLFYGPGFSTYSLHVPSIFQTCSMHVPELCVRYSIRIPNLFHTYSSHTLTYSRHIPYILHTYASHVQYIFHTYASHIPYIFHTHSIHVTCIFNTYTTHSYTCSIDIS